MEGNNEKKTINAPLLKDTSKTKSNDAIKKKLKAIDESLKESRKNLFNNR